MPGHDEMVATVHAYVRGFAESDVTAISDLFAQDATVEDPYGTPPHVGLEAIRRFYSGLIDAGGASLVLQGPIRTTADSAAFAFSAHLARPDGDLQIDVIDVFQFGASGKISSMRAYWGRNNVHA